MVCNLVRLRVALLVAVCAGPAPVFPQAESEEEPESVVLELAAPAWDGARRTLTVLGQTNLPERTVLACQMKLGENEGPRAQALVEKGGRVQFQFVPLSKRQTLIPGTYRFEATCLPADQPAALRAEMAKLPPIAPVSVEAPIGEPGEEKELRDRLHGNLVEIYSTLRRLFMTTETHGSFAIARVFNARRKAGGNLSPEEGKRIIADWERYGEQHFDDNMRSLVLNFRDYQESCYISPFAEVDRDLSTLLDITRRWYADTWVSIAGMLELSLPREIRDDANFPKKVLLPQVAAASARVARTLGVAFDDWIQVNAFRPEEGITRGTTYMSKTSKFEVSLPNEEWEFNQDLVHPQIRIRLCPQDDERKKWGVVAVELRDYPECESTDDLDTAVEIDASERWPGYKKVKGGPVKIDDSQMEEGKRPGYYLNFIALAADKKVFRVVDYALYCRWFKRTYSVIMIVDEAHYAEFEKELEKIKTSFKVLDKQS